jgi:hypothetical protein
VAITDIASSSALAIDIADEINAAHEQAENSLRASVELALRVGELLLQAKRTFGRHGKWTDWLKANIKFSDRLAQAYMRLARLPVENRNGLRNLSLRDALSAIRSREKQLAEAEERTNQPPAKAIAIGAYYEPPPAEPASPDEVAGDLVDQLEEAISTQDVATVEHVRIAFERRFAQNYAITETGEMAKVAEIEVGPDSTGEPVKNADDIGPNSNGELARLQALIGELEADNRRLEIENLGLRSEVEELRAALKAAAPADDDGLGIPESLRRHQEGAP